MDAHSFCSFHSELLTVPMTCRVPKLHPSFVELKSEGSQFVEGFSRIRSDWGGSVFNIICSCLFILIFIPTSLFNAGQQDVVCLKCVNAQDYV